MAINALTLAWLDRLRQRGILSGGAVLDLGPQDLIACPREAVLVSARRWHAPELADRLVEAIYDGDRFRQIGGAAALFRLYGFAHYRSLDLFDPRADWRADLNGPIAFPERFDVVVNFGTVEHVFNVANAFRAIHDALAPGGVALHGLPAFGDVNHGFFNIHPTVYFDLSDANGYTIEDYAYVDSIDVRNHLHAGDPSAAFDFDALPIQRTDLALPGLYGKIANQWVAMFNRHASLRGVNQAPKDYSFVAIRKRQDAPFRLPLQGAYAASGDGRYDPDATNPGAAGQDLNA